MGCDITKKSLAKVTVGMMMRLGSNRRYSQVVIQVAIGIALTADAFAGPFSAVGNESLQPGSVRY